MFADILEENEDLPLISFDQSILGTTPTPDPSPLPDGYIADGGRASADFSNSPGPAGDTAAGDVQSKGGGGGGVSGDYVGALQPSSSLQVSSPAPLPTSTSSQLQPPPPHISSSVSSPSHSPPPPSHTHPSPTHPSPTTQPPPATTSSTSKVYVHIMCVCNYTCWTQPTYVYNSYSVQTGQHECCKCECCPACTL